MNLLILKKIIDVKVDGMDYKNSLLLQNPHLAEDLFNNNLKLISGSSSYDLFKRLLATEWEFLAIYTDKPDLAMSLYK